LRKTIYIFFIAFQFVITNIVGQTKAYDIVIIGGSASGTTAALQAGRLGHKVLLIEEGPWLGGMITAAGVSAFDGNHQLAGGIFKEFRDSLYQHYGDPEAVSTGWVSNTLFEPHVGNAIFQNMIKKVKNIEVAFNSKTKSFVFDKDKWIITAIINNKKKRLTSIVLIDATEAAYLGLPSRIGMDSGELTNESFVPTQGNNIIQDLTYTMILKDYGKGIDRTIPRPKGYDKSLFSCCCDTADPAEKKGPRMDCSKMMQYGKLPNDKYMINWPNCGNDIYLNLIDLPLSKRNKELEKAKLLSLQFLYFLQTELGYKNLSLAEDEFPTSDHLPIIPYHRESRRVHGLSYLKVDHLIKPYDQYEKYYRTGIAVGDYPIDHHHKKNLAAPKFDFINIKIGAFNIPLGSLIPRSAHNFIVAEKSISVSNIVNGTTRLQPVVMGLGQAAGALAAEAIEKKVKVAEVNVRNVQLKLLNADAYMMPYIDVKLDDQDFVSIQKIGATGILKGVCIPYKWANQCWFYPDSLVKEDELIDGLLPYFAQQLNTWTTQDQTITISKLIDLISTIRPSVKKDALADFLNALPSDGNSQNRMLNRREVSITLDKFLNPYETPIDFDGRVLKKNR
jgi:hypothetical protein